VKSTWIRLKLLAAVVMAFACNTCAQTSLQSAASALGGTSWQLVRFQSGDGMTLTPDDKGKYTIQFNRDGALSARIDCNRGTGTWKSWGANQLEFGRLALTRAMCRRGRCTIRSSSSGITSAYIIKDGHLFLSLMADGGIYEFEPIVAPHSASAAERDDVHA
jgi:para-nitrobenzyl esterase